MFKTNASKTATGNYLVEASCKGNPSHTVFKDQFNVNGPYKCPYCGNDVY